MVSYKQLKASNSLITDDNVPKVAVFAGGTSGVGQLTIKALVATGTSVKIYLVGRKSSYERSLSFIQELQAVNPKAVIEWVEGDISLLQDTKRICDVIKTKETAVDLLVLTAGYAPFGTRIETTEGIEITQSLSYYGRTLFISQLLPLLGKAQSPRVLSVLGGGMESLSGFHQDDIDLQKPGNFDFRKSQVQYIALNTITMDKLADENPHVTFIHSAPGLINTGNLWRGVQDRHSATGWLVWMLLAPMVYLFSISNDESAQRHLFYCTSGVFGGSGTPWEGKAGVNSRGREENGLFLVNYKGDCKPNQKVIPVLRDKARDQVWKHTQDILGPFL